MVNMYTKKREFMSKQQFCEGRIKGGYDYFITVKSTFKFLYHNFRKISMFGLGFSQKFLFITKI